jgi:hypothetical protein
VHVPNLEGIPLWQREDFCPLKKITGGDLLDNAIVQQETLIDNAIVQHEPLIQFKFTLHNNSYRSPVYVNWLHIYHLLILPTGNNEIDIYNALKIKGYEILVVYHFKADRGAER